MSQASVHSQSQPQPQTQQPSQASNTERSESFHTPDGPPQPHSREEIAQLNSQRSKKAGSEQKETISADEELTNEKAQELGLPEQTHAGKIGYGPEYRNQNHVGLSEKIHGFKEEIIGHIKRDPGAVARGKEKKTGELKRKEQEEKEQDNNPFAKSEDSQPSPSHDDTSTNQGQKKDESSTDQSQKGSGPNVKFANGQTNNSTNLPSTNQPRTENIDSDRRQVQEEQQVGKTRGVDLNPGAGRMGSDE